jgi:hypothetical protein
MFAFSNKQFEEGMKEKFGIEPNRTDLIYSLGAGTFILKTDSEKLSEMTKKQRQEMKDHMHDDDFCIGAMVYELGNHEYCITYDVSDTIDALSLNMKDSRIDMLMGKAIKIYMKSAVE